MWVCECARVGVHGPCGSKGEGERERVRGGLGRVSPKIAGRNL
jgi:hypothetical protein